MTFTSTHLLKCVTFACAVAAFSVSPALAQVKMDGYILASKSCEAYQSAKRRSNPGKVKTVEGQIYPLLALNKPQGEFYLIRIPGAPGDEKRWISTVCGTPQASRKASITPGTKRPSNQATPSRVSTNNVLVLNWLPTFCEDRPRKRECQALNNNRLPNAARRFSIHGLWPQPRDKEYCNVSSRDKALDRSSWRKLPAPDIDRATAKKLAQLMPGAASDLHRHEWIKHGTCYLAAGGADEYFDDMIQLTEEINHSAVVDLLTSNIGRELLTSTIRTAFDKAFGPGTGDRVSIKCANDGRRVLLSELWINLNGHISPESGLGTLTRNARKARGGCRSAIIDPAGQQ
ncbi:ribonuclease T2 family protein [Roseibium sp.]|uniref:ribonuclease T2 family protein n=1 Tax=Roseibium sp. TaxID=1936156 RepID=UPI003A96A82C